MVARGGEYYDTARVSHLVGYEEARWTNSTRIGGINDASTESLRNHSHRFRDSGACTFFSLFNGLLNGVKP